LLQQALFSIFSILQAPNPKLAMASKLIAIVAGVGPGTGAAVARKFAAKYPVVLLSRTPESYNDLVKEINSNGGKAIGISTNVADAKSVQNAADAIKKEFGSEVGAAVSNTTLKNMVTIRRSIWLIIFYV
jgi:NAD(P)-dependent dehydrogenase (short-subunit alcohol dehydrogenase family)